MSKLVYIYQFILDLIFPRSCVGCQTEGNWICPDCEKQIFVIKKPYCPACHRLTPKGQYCIKCKKNYHLTGVIIATYYKKGPIKEAIHSFKYENITSLKDKLGSLVAQSIQDRHIGANLVLIPVPLHPKRQLERGYNQALLLSQIISKHLNIPIISNKLVRIKSTPRQADLTRTERLNNVQGIFDWKDSKDNLSHKTIILVDDVLTTGATLSECAKVLRQKTSARRIWGAVIAKG